MNCTIRECYIGNQLTCAILLYSGVSFLSSAFVLDI